MAIKRILDNLTQEEALKRAQDAANRRVGSEMLQGLFDSMLFEGYQGYFRKRYPSIPVDDVYDIIGSATDEMYDRIVRGGKILSIKNYLWKIIDRKLSEFASSSKNLIGGSKVENIVAQDRVAGEEVTQEEKEKRREYIISIAEKLLPRLGLVNVQHVMSYILGAIRNGAEDVTSTEIADALSLSPSNVRQAMKRGFERLARIIREENLVDETYGFPFLQEMEYYMNEGENENEDMFEGSEEVG